MISCLLGIWKLAKASYKNTVPLRVTSEEFEEDRDGTKEQGTGANGGLLLCQPCDICCVA